MWGQGGLGKLGGPSGSLSHSRAGGMGGPRPWRRLGVSPRLRAREGHHERTETGKVSGRERQAKCPERGRAAVLAEPSTEEGGELRPTEPTGGKATPGITLSWRDRREIL